MLICYVCLVTLVNAQLASTLLARAPLPDPERCAASPQH